MGVSMNPDQIVACIKKEFPGKNIVLNPPEHPTEILCETDPSSLHSGFSAAVAYIHSSLPHRHLKATETYTLKSGDLTLYLDGVASELYPDQPIVIPPQKIHWAVGDWARVLVESRPGWTFDDHLLTPRAVSAGGIILRDNQILFVTLPGGKVTFPKGHIESGETLDQAALREVAEETGLAGLEIIRKLGVVTRPAVERNGQVVIKDIHLFLISPKDFIQSDSDEQTVWLDKKASSVRLFPQELSFLNSLNIW